MMKTSALILTFVLTVFSSFAQAEQIRIITASLPPYGYLENSRISGLSHDIAMAIALEAGCKPAETLGPLSRGVRDLASGEGDVLIMIPTPEIEAHAINLGSVIPVETVVVGLRGVPLRTLDDIRGKSLAAVRDARYDDRINLANGMQVYPTEDYEHSLKMLTARRVDFVLGPRLGLFHSARKLKLPRATLGQPLVLSSVQGCLFVSRKTHSDTVQKLRLAKQRLMQDGTIQSIWAKYNL